MSLIHYIDFDSSLVPISTYFRILLYLYVHGITILFIVYCTVLQVDMSNPENLLKLTKKGRTLMAFVSVGSNPTRDETEQLTKLWQGSLWNNHIQAER